MSNENIVYELHQIQQKLNDIEKKLQLLSGTKIDKMEILPPSNQIRIVPGNLKPIIGGTPYFGPYKIIHPLDISFSELYSGICKSYQNILNLSIPRKHMVIISQEQIKNDMNSNKIMLNRKQYFEAPSDENIKKEIDWENNGFSVFKALYVLKILPKFYEDFKLELMNVTC